MVLTSCLLTHLGSVIHTVRSILDGPDQTTTKYVFQISSCHDSSFTKNNSAPDSIDWRKNGAVLPVTNQGSLGKSAYFATTDTVASIWYRKTGDLVPLSVQQLSDCSTNYFDLYQFNYIIDTKGDYDANYIFRT